MNRQPRTEEVTIISKDETSLKTDKGFRKVSKFSAMQVVDFEVGKTYKVESQDYEYQGFLRTRILREVK